MLDSFKDSQGNPIVKESMTADGPVKMLFGSKLNETEAITAAFTSSTSGVFADNVLPGFYGDLKRYTAIQPSTAAMKVDRSRLVEKDQTLVIALTWIDGHPIDSEAFGVVKIVS
jgi:HK97 family phage major capsid protein